MTTNAADVLNRTTILGRSAANTGAHPKQALVDVGYCSEATRSRAGTSTVSAEPTSSAAGRLPAVEQRS